MNVSDQVKFLMKLYERLNNTELFVKQIKLLIQDEQVNEEAIQLVILIYDIKQLYHLLNDSLIAERKKKYKQEQINAKLITDTLAGLDTRRSTTSSVSYDPCSGSSYSRRSIRGGC